jgi:oligosaccharide repeat unit polymerase
MPLSNAVFPGLNPDGAAFPQRPVPMTPALKAIGLLLIMVPLSLLIMALLSGGDDYAERLEWFISGGVTLIVIVIIHRRLHLDWLSPTIAYLGLFWMFHFGLVFPSSLVIEILDGFPKWATDWLFKPDAILAVRLSFLFYVCVAAGAGAVILLCRNGRGTREEESAPEFTVAGTATVLIGLTITGIALFKFGYRVYFQPYEEFFTVHNMFSQAVVIIGLGFCFLVIGSPQPVSVLRSGALVYLPVALPPLLAGARGAPLFASVVLAVVLVRKGLRIGAWKLWVGILLVLALTATIKDTRQEGVGRLVESVRLAEIESPLSGLMELGGSLRPVAATIDYMQREPFFLGETYAYPFYRQLLKAQRIELEPELQDKRLIATQVNLAYGSIGYSTVAEAYANGGVVGVVLFALLLGAVLGGFETRWRGPYGQAALAVFLIPVMMNIRNSFIFVPAWITMGMIPIFVARILRKRRMLCLVTRPEVSQSASDESVSQGGAGWVVGEKRTSRGRRGAS